MGKAITNLTLLILIAFVSVDVSSAQKNSDRKAQLSEYLLRAEANGFSGQVLIAEKGRIVLSEPYGFADRERHIRNSLATPFNIASLTKQFTAAAILRLEADGKLSVSDPIGKYLSAIPDDKAAITIHQLLTHSSGLSRGQDGKRNSIDRDEAVSAILKRPLAAKVGEKFIYSNDGYHLLAAIIEKVSGISYKEYLTEKLFKPAGMMNSGFYQDEQWATGPSAASFNEWKRLPSFTEWNKVWNYGPGSIISTTGDLYKWFTALTKGKILPEASKQKLFKSYQDSFDENTFYGYGWYVEKLKDGSDLIFHGGDNQGYHSEFRWYVKDDVVMIILTNYEILEPDGVAIQKRVIANNLKRVIAGDEYKQPPAFKKLATNSIKKMEGEFRSTDGARAKIWSNGAFLYVGVEGQSLIDIAAGYQGETAKKYAEANLRTAAIIEAIKNGETDKIRQMLPKDAYDFYIPFLAQQIKEFSEKLGTFAGFRVQGTSSFPWDPNSYRTYVALDFEKGTNDLFLGWNDGALNDVTTETGRPFPWIMPLVPVSGNEAATFEFLRSKETRFALGEKGVLNVTGAGGSFSLTRKAL